MGRHLHYGLLIVALLGIGAASASAQGVGADGLDAPPGSEGPATSPGSGDAPAGDAPAGDAPPGDAPAGDGSADPPESGEDAAGGTAGEPAPDNAGAEPPAQLQIVVIDAAPHGVSPVVGQHVTAQMRATAQEMGYVVVGAAETVQAAQRVRMPYPPAPAELWRATYASGSQRGAFAKVWAHAGRYVFELTVASLDGSGPFFARGTSGAEDLHEVVARLTREALPAPTTYDVEAAQRYAQGQPSTGQAAGGSAGQAAATWTPPEPVDRVRAAQRRVSRRPTRRFDVGFQTESAFGTSSEFFYNHMLGVRLGFRISHTFHLGLYLAYTNLRGRDSRKSNLLPMLQLTQRIRLGSRTSVTVPIRASLGYLPFNGPVLRLSAGLNIPVSDRVEIGADILAPTFWFVSDELRISLNIGLEVILRL